MFARSAMSGCALGLLVATILGLAGCDATSVGSSAGSSAPSGTATGSVALWQLPVPTTDKPMSTSEAARIDAAAAAALKASADRTPGMIIGVWDPQKGFYVHAYGDAQRGGPKLTTDTQMYIGSITKTATATAILRLVAQGGLRLEDTVASVDPELAAKFPAIAGITIKQLLAMASGLPDYANPPGRSMPKLLADPSTAFTPEDLIRDALASAPTDPPGSAAYINTNYIILGEILAKVTGRPAHEAINQVFTDLGLTHTKLAATGTEGLPEPASHGYYGDQQAAVDKAAGATYGYDASTDVTTWNTSWAGAAGGAYTTIGDLQKWASSGSGSTLLSTGLAEARLTPTAVLDASVTEGAEGLGIFNRDGWIGHDGQLIGWEAEEKYNTGTGAMFLALVNSTSGLADAETIRDMYFPELAGMWPALTEALKSAEFVPVGMRESPSAVSGTASASGTQTASSSPS